MRGNISSYKDRVDPCCPHPSTMASKYRGAVVEDLQLAPAFCLPATASLSAALEAAYEREFDQLPCVPVFRSLMPSR